MPLLPHAETGHVYPRVTSARVLSAVFNIVVGVRLLLPDNILGNPRSPSYRLLDAHFFGDVPLGFALLAFGLVMGASLYTDRWPRAVDVASWLSMLTWLLVAVDIARAVGIAQLGTLTYALDAALNAYAYAHLLSWRDQLRRHPEDGSA